MKKSLIVLSILLVLAIIAFPLIEYFKKPTLRERADFAISNPETIDSVFLVNRQGDYVLLRKVGEDRWTVNNQFNAEPGKVTRLLETLTKIEAKNPVAEKSQQVVINDLATDGIKVEVYQKGEKTVTYYVGRPTVDETGTFMYIDGSTIPFVVHVPGFRGYLSPRYSPNPTEWRDKNIFNTPVERLTSVTVTYPDSAFKSFELRRSPANDFTVAQDGKTAVPAKDYFSKLYVAQFNKVTFETYLRGYSQSYIDSLHSARPMVIINVKRTDNSQAVLRIYQKPITSDTKSLYDDKGNLLVYDADNYFALIEGSPELITVQDYVFRHVLKGYKDFVETGK